MRLIGISQSKIVEVRDQNMHGSESIFDQIYEGGKGRPLVMPKYRIVRVWDQNVYGPKSSIDHMYEGGNLRSIAMPLGRDQILLSPGRDIDGNLTRDKSYDNIWGKVNNQNLYGYHPTQVGSYQSLATNEQVLNPNEAGLDLNFLGVQGGLILTLMPLNLLPDLELNLTP